MQKKLLALILCFPFCSLFADSPLDPPEIRTYWNHSREFYAISSPGENPGTIGYSAEDDTEIWKIKKWFRQGWIGHRGESFIAMHNGVNLIPIDSPDDTVLLSFWNMGTLKKEYSLKELNELGLKLKRTTSHFSWASEFELISMGFRLVDESGNEFIFMPDSGKLIFKGKLKPVYE